MSEQRFRVGHRAVHPTTGHEVIVVSREHAEALTELAGVIAERDCYRAALRGRPYVMNDQRSTTDQVRDLIDLADKVGLYDAADFCRRAIER